MYLQNLSLSLFLSLSLSLTQTHHYPSNLGPTLSLHSNKNVSNKILLHFLKWHRSEWELLHKRHHFTEAKILRAPTHQSQVSYCKQMNKMRKCTPFWKKMSGKWDDIFFPKYINCRKSCTKGVQLPSDTLSRHIVALRNRDVTDWKCLQVAAS